MNVEKTPYPLKFGASAKKYITEVRAPFSDEIP